MSKYGVPSKRISIWEKDALSYLSESFDTKPKSSKKGGVKAEFSIMFILKDYGET